MIIFSQLLHLIYLNYETMGNSETSNHLLSMIYKEKKQ